MVFETAAQFWFKLLAGQVPRPDLADFLQGPGDTAEAEFAAYKAAYDANRAKWLATLTADQRAEIDLGSSKVKIFSF